MIPQRNNTSSFITPRQPGRAARPGRRSLNLHPGRNSRRVTWHWNRCPAAVRGRVGVTVSAAAFAGEAADRRRTVAGCCVHVCSAGGGVGALNGVHVPHLAAGPLQAVAPRAAHGAAACRACQRLGLRLLVVNWETRATVRSVTAP